jgi:sulfite exporter TauE/SafE/plastocyanin domain-containing protein/copper chaperone CopZ
MEPKLVNQTFQVKGMTCPSCELKIENILKKIEGVINVKASLAQSTVEVYYNAGQVESEQLTAAIVKLGYEITTKSGQNGGDKKLSINQLLGVGIIVFALYWIIKSTIGFNFIPQVDDSVGYGMLFVIGLFTSLHCIAMCGGINMSQCIKAPPSGIDISQCARINAGTSKPEEAELKFAKFKPSFFYNTGRVISYTIIGGIVGALGSVIGFSGAAKGLVVIIGGVFMVIIGINMLDIFPWLRKLRISTPKFFGNKIYNNAGKRGPFYIGLLNGLMPCGPLQTMQLYALGTGSFWAGAIAMFLFSLGTVPLMFGFGALSSFLSSKFTHRMLKASAVLVIVLGLTMVSRGLNLSGISLAASDSLGGNTSRVAQIQGGTQTVTTTIESGRYQPFIVQKGIPVRWIIKAKAEDLNGCNNPITIPQYNIQKSLIPGDNVIEFTPMEEGNITYTCWMGMISSNIKVVSNISKVTREDLNQINNDNNSPQSGGGGCCSAGSKATKFYGGKVPTDDIRIAGVVNGVQEVTITVNDEGYSPAAVILQRGIKAKIKFNPEKLNSCNYAVAFPDFRGQLDLSQGQTETPALDVTRDFTFQCWMGMLNGYVKVVDDINNIDMNAITKEIKAYRPTGGGGGCCGR